MSRALAALLQGPLARGIILLYATSTVLSRVLLGRCAAWRLPCQTLRSRPELSSRAAVPAPRRHYLGDVLAGVAVGAILTAGLQRALPGDTELCPPGLLSS